MHFPRHFPLVNWKKHSSFSEDALIIGYHTLHPHPPRPYSHVPPAPPTSFNSVWLHAPPPWLGRGLMGRPGPLPPPQMLLPPCSSTWMVARASSSRFFITSQRGDSGRRTWGSGLGQGRVWAEGCEVEVFGGEGRRTWGRGRKGWGQVEFFFGGR